MKTASIEKSTDAQFLELKTQFEHTARVAAPTKTAAQNLIARWNEAKKLILPILEQLAITNPFEKEKVSPNGDWRYDTATLPNLDTQVARIMGALTGVGPVGIGHAPAWQGEITDKADGLTAIPSLLDLGKMLEVDDPLGAGYGQLLEKVLDRLSAARNGKFYNYRKGQLGPNYVRLHEGVRQRREELENAIPYVEQKIRFLIAPVSTGRHYQGYSPRNARIDALELGALPLDPISVALMLVAWPERLNKYPQTLIDCSGCEYSWDADGEWTRVCYFYFDVSELEFDARDAGLPRDGCGAAVAFPGVSAP
jgi:hypothetical protein